MLVGWYVLKRRKMIRLIVGCHNEGEYDILLIYAWQVAVVGNFQCATCRINLEALYILVILCLSLHLTRKSPSSVPWESLCEWHCLRQKMSLVAPFSRKEWPYHSKLWFCNTSLDSCNVLYTRLPLNSIETLDVVWNNNQISSLF